MERAEIDKWHTHICGYIWVWNAITDRSTHSPRAVLGSETHQKQQTAQAGIYGTRDSNIYRSWTQASGFLVVYLKTAKHFLGELYFSTQKINMLVYNIYTFGNTSIRPPQNT